MGGRVCVPRRRLRRRPAGTRPGALQCPRRRALGPCAYPAARGRIWNAAGEEPPNIADLAADSEPVWLGDWSLPPPRQGRAPPRARCLRSPPAQLEGPPVATHARP